MHHADSHQREPPVVPFDKQHECSDATNLPNFDILSCWMLFHVRFAKEGEGSGVADLFARLRNNHMKKCMAYSQHLSKFNQLEEIQVEDWGRTWAG